MTKSTSLNPIKGKAKIAYALQGLDNHIEQVIKRDIGQKVIIKAFTYVENPFRSGRWVDNIHRSVIFEAKTNEEE